jgi:hypothetical protein
LLDAKFAKKMIFESLRNVFFIFTVNLPVPAVYAQLSESPVKKQDFVVIFSEIMADPTPALDLPAYEYIEILNRGNATIDLTNWMLNLGDHEKIVIHGSIGPGEYRIFCDESTDSMFRPYGSTLPLQAMPAIVNTGQNFTLKDPSGNVVHSVSFNPDWYNNEEKDDGGYSLEIKDPNNPCGGIVNWCSSEAAAGGTPGSKNSVSSQNPDLKPPLFLRATLPSELSVMLHFSEPLNIATTNSLNYYSVNKELFHPDQVKAVEPDFDKMLLTYSVPFKPDYIYTVTVLDSLKDCVGNPLTGQTFRDFTVPQIPAKYEILINELMFKTSADRAEYIELYNRSERTLNISALELSLADDFTGNLQKTIYFRDYPYLLFPQQYIVITHNARKLPRTCLEDRPQVILEHQHFFRLPDDAGMIVLTDSADNLIDQCLYNEAMHNSSLGDFTNIALERVTDEPFAGDKETWHSASSASGYSTSGTKNSQSLEEDQQFTISLYPEIFSPDQDGVDDVTTLTLKLDKPGWIGTVAV